MTTCRLKSLLTYQSKTVSLTRSHIDGNYKRGKKNINFKTYNTKLQHLSFFLLSLWLAGWVTGSTLGLRSSRWSACTAEDAQALQVISASQWDAFACECKSCVCFGNLSASEASLQERVHQVLLAPLTSKHVFYGLHKRIVHWRKTEMGDSITVCSVSQPRHHLNSPVSCYWFSGACHWWVILLCGMSSALYTFSDSVAQRRVTPAGSSRLLSMSSWSSFVSPFSACSRRARQ